MGGAMQPGWRFGYLRRAKEARGRLDGASLILGVRRELGDAWMALRLSSAREGG